MKNNMKLNVLLAKTETLATGFKHSIAEYIKFFKDNQGAFKGIKKTYTPREGTIDVPGNREYKQVQTTVDEKLVYFVDQHADYIDSLFSQERTNASGKAVAELVVDDVSWGEFTSLELLRLKSFLETATLGEMLSKLPVKSDTKVWNKSTDSDYTGREIYETKRTEGVNKSVSKETIILEDPNVSQLKDASGYKPQTAVRDTVVELGDYTLQEFSGEWTHTQRAHALANRQKLLTAVIVALKIANECDTVKSDLTAEKIFDFIFKGK